MAADTSGNAYVTGNATSSTFPVTSGAFQYDGYESGSGGVYVTKLNPTGTALVYSAYLGYGTGYGIAVDTAPDAYVTGPVGYEDFPTTTGAYQTTYPGGFVVKLNTAGSAETYSTFLGGPSSTGTNVVPWSLALENGCASPATPTSPGGPTRQISPPLTRFRAPNPLPANPHLLWSWPRRVIARCSQAT